MTSRTTIPDARAAATASRTDGSEAHLAARCVPSWSSATTDSFHRPASLTPDSTAAVSGSKISWAAARTRSLGADASTRVHRIEPVAVCDLYAPMTRVHPRRRHQPFRRSSARPTNTVAGASSHTPANGDASSRCYTLDGTPIAGVCEDCVDNHRMTVSQHQCRPAWQRARRPRCETSGRVGRRPEPDQGIEMEQLLSHLVAAKHDGAGRASDDRGQTHCQRRLSRARQPSDCNRARRWGQRRNASRPATRYSWAANVHHPTIVGVVLQGRLRSPRVLALIAARQARKSGRTSSPS